MRSWRNWQTRKTKDLVGNSMQVQFLSTAPQKRKSHSRFPFLFVALFSTRIEGGSRFVRTKRFALKTLENEYLVGKVGSK